MQRLKDLLPDGTVKEYGYNGFRNRTSVKVTEPLQRGRCSRLEIFSSIVIRFIEAFIMIWILIVIVEKINKIMLENKAKYILIVKLATVGTAITLLLDMM